jgi:hypothetical protein
MASSNMYRLEPIPGAGLGMVATAFIPRGTQILAEPPLFTLSADFSNPTQLTAAIEAKVRALSSDAQRTAFFALHNNYATDRAISAAAGIVKTNAHPLGVGARECGLFPECSRFNHSCASNSSYTWIAATGKETIFAGKDIPAGQQITVNYLDEHSLLQKRSDRRAAILALFRFECGCDVCAGTPAEVAASNARRVEIARLDRLIGGGGMLVMVSPARCLDSCKQILQLYMDEGMNDDALFKTYNDAFQICVMHGDLARASAFAALAVTCTGAGGPSLESVRPYVEHPESHAYAGMSQKWRTERRMFRGLDQNGFEKWLWKRADW